MSNIPECLIKQFPPEDYTSEHIGEIEEGSVYITTLKELFRSGALVHVIKDNKIAAFYANFEAIAFLEAKFPDKKD